MLLLFILIGLLALGLPLIIFLMGDPPAPPPPVQPKAAVVQPAPVVLPIEVPQAASSESVQPAAGAPTPAVSQVGSKPATTAGEAASLPGLPEGTKLPSEAELLKELQRLLEEQAKAGKEKWTP